MAYWAAAQLQPQRERVALHFLQLAGYATYFPCICEQRIRRGRRVAVRTALFPGYAFVAIELQWHTARWCPGVVRLVLAGDGPARVSSAVITDIRGRERNGVIELPSRLRCGDRVRIARGPLREQLALYAGQAPHQRVAVLLALLGAQQRVLLPRGDIEAVGDRQ